jgi:hypothetical protein
LVINA